MTCMVGRTLARWSGYLQFNKNTFGEESRRRVIAFLVESTTIACRGIYTLYPWRLHMIHLHKHLVDHHHFPNCGEGVWGRLFPMVWCCVPPGIGFDPYTLNRTLFPFASSPAAKTPVAHIERNNTFILWGIRCTITATIELWVRSMAPY